MFAKKLPIPIDAFQVKEGVTVPDWAQGKLVVNRYDPDQPRLDYFSFESTEGIEFAGEGDWILKDVKGNLYMNEDEAFRKSYEPTEDGRFVKPSDAPAVECFVFEEGTTLDDLPNWVYNAGFASRSYDPDSQVLDSITFYMPWGDLVAEPGKDIIIMQSEADMYPCKADVFNETYGVTEAWQEEIDALRTIAPKSIQALGDPTIKRGFLDQQSPTPDHPALSPLASLRKSRGFRSAKQFAEELGMPYYSYIRYEHAAASGIPMKAALQIADALDCSLDEVVGRNNPELSTAFAERLEDEYRRGFDEGFASADDWLAEHEDELAEHGWVKAFSNVNEAPLQEAYASLSPESRSQLDDYARYLKLRDALVASAKESINASEQIAVIPGKNDDAEERAMAVTELASLMAQPAQAGPMQKQ